MEDARRYAARPPPQREGERVREIGSHPRSIYPAYIEPGFPSSASHSLYSSAMYRSSRDYLERDIESSRYRDYGLDSVSSLAALTESRVSGIGSVVNIGSYRSPYEDSSLLNQRPDVSRLLKSGISDPLYERSTLLQRNSLQRDDGRISEPLYDRHSSLQRDDGLSSSANESSMLFVDGLPRDCTRREVGHLFRPFIGFKDIRVVHKEPRRTGDKAMVLCFVEFDNPTCARTAMDALQGYQFDHKAADPPILHIYFAQFPFKLPSASSSDDQ